MRILTYDDYTVFDTLDNYGKFKWQYLPNIKRRLIQEMYEIGYTYDFIENGYGKNCPLLFYDECTHIWLNNWKEVWEYVRNYCE